MSRLDELIQKLCPNGVEYRELNEVCRFQNGFAFKSGLFSESGLPILRITNISDGKLSDDGYVYFNPNDYKENLNNYIVKPENIVVAMSGATTGKIGYNYSEKDYYLNQRVGMFLPDESFLLNRYLYHWLLGQSGNILAISSGTGAQPNLSSVKMMKFKIPVPPLEVQHEIVRILDSFTELTARKKQYEFYRNALLKFDNDMQMVKLGELCKITRGIRVTRSELNGDSGYPVYQNSLTPMGYYNKPNRKANTSFIISAGAAGEIGYSTEDYWAADDCLTFECTSSLNDRFLYHFFKTKQEYLYSRVRKASIPRLSREVLEKLEIPFLPIEIQNRLVGVLDNFDAICSDLNIGLPAEIEARQKQYEYYRDALLTYAATGKMILRQTDRQTDIMR